VENRKIAIVTGGSSGMGVDIDEKAAEKFPYEKASLPVNRKTDGTMFYW
jgi:mannonate dehydratase